MLLGPSIRPKFPQPPREVDGFQGILRYLEDLERNLGSFLSTVVSSTIGMTNLRGLSSSGVGARNFTKGWLSIGGATSATWSLLNVEPDTSYMILYSPSRTTGMVLTNLTMQTTGVVFTFNPSVPSGIQLNVMLVR